MGFDDYDNFYLSQNRFDESGFDDKVIAREIVQAAKSGKTEGYASVGESASGISASQAARAKDLLQQDKDKLAQSKPKEIKGLDSKLAQQDAEYQKAIKDAEAAGWMSDTGIPVKLVDGKLVYDLEKIGVELGMTPEQISSAEATTFGPRRVGTEDAISDMIGGQVGEKQLATTRKFQGIAGNLSPEESIISNLAGLDPTKARVDFSKEDHLINLAKGGYMKDRIGDQRDLLDEGQAPSGWGAYAGAIVPSLVASAMTLMTAGAGSPLAGALVSGGLGTMKGLREDETSLGDIAKNFAVGAGTSLATSAASSALKSGFEAAKTTGNLTDGLTGAWEGLQDWGGNLMDTFDGALNVADATSHLSPAQQVNQWGEQFGGSVMPGSGGNIVDSYIHSQDSIVQSPTGPKGIMTEPLPDIATPNEFTGGMSPEDEFEAAQGRFGYNQNMELDKTFSRQATLGQYASPSLSDVGMELGNIAMSFLPSLLSGGTEKTKGGGTQGLQGLLGGGMNRLDPASQLQIRGSQY